MSNSNVIQSKIKLDTSSTKYLPVKLNGIVTVSAGLFFLMSKYLEYCVVKSIVGILLVIGAMLGFLVVLSKHRKKVAFLYHAMHALAMIVFGVTVLLYANNTTTLTNFTSYLFFFYAFSEIIFCIWLFNLMKKVNFRIAFVRVIMALFIGIGVIVIMYYPNILPETALQSFGLLFILIGVNTFQYIPILRSQHESNTI